MMDSNSDGDFKAIYESCEEGIIAFSHSGDIVMANGAAHRIFGYGPSELTKYTLNDLVPVKLSNAHHKYSHAYFHAPKPRKMGEGRDLMGRKKNGEHFPVEVSLNTVLLQNEQHVVAFIIDITQRKVYEEALKKSEEQLLVYASALEERVKARTKELEDVNQALEKQIEISQKSQHKAVVALEKEKELSELKSRFVAMASHEFRTPLSTILSSTSLINKYLEKQEIPKSKRHITKIQSAIKNLNTILDDFLSISKLEEGKIEIEFNELDLKEILLRTRDQISILLKPDQQINVDIEEDIYVKSDEKILINVLLNILSNAIKYSERHIDLISKKNEDMALIMIRDKGIGIAKEEQEQLFTRFYRAKNAINIQGTGLGLHIVHKYLELLGGNIEIKSELNSGTTVFIRLPYLT